MKIKATVISLGAFGLSKEFVTLTKFGRTDSAQYKNVPFYQFIQKGKRKEFRRTLCGNSTVMILNGHAEIEVPSGLEKTELGISSRFATFAPEYKDEAINFFGKVRTLSPFKILLEVSPGCESISEILNEPTSSQQQKDGKET